MGLLDGKLGKPHSFDSLSTKSVLIGSGLMTGCLTLGIPWLAFATFTAQDKNGYIDAFLAFVTLLWLLGVFIFLAASLAAYMEWRRDE